MVTGFEPKVGLCLMKTLLFRQRQKAKALLASPSQLLPAHPVSPSAPPTQLQYLLKRSRPQPPARRPSGFPKGHTLSEDEDEERPGDQGLSVTLSEEKKCGSGVLD